ncbi:DUF1850 domain-containing protein [Halomarina ordinaria]|uniref:DUF1850 domain-containing protein n=1 Tax=Halomarina ordinaria TaxID=3033939 RepID=A0ABD5UG83_9EURY|nr:DUF1850 domain-containing protein [Halomarina sp. PSRA2]
MRTALGVGAAALVCLLVVGGAAAVPADRALVVSDTETGERLLVTPVEENTTVALEYTHSVEKTRVLDVYEVRGDRLVTTRMEFESYGWGLPADANVTMTENDTFAYNPGGSFEELYVKPGRIAGHRLHVGDRTYDLVERSDARSVHLTVERRSALDVALSHLP